MIFLSSNEAQEGAFCYDKTKRSVLSFLIVVNALWRGDLIQINNAHDEIECECRSFLHPKKLRQYLV